MVGFLAGCFVGFFLGWICCALMVRSGRDADEVERMIEIPRTPVCKHPGACERTEDGYCGRCHAELYP